MVLSHRQMLDRIRGRATPTAREAAQANIDAAADLHNADDGYGLDRAGADARDTHIALAIAQGLLAVADAITAAAQAPARATTVNVQAPALATADPDEMARTLHANLDLDEPWAIVSAARRAAYAKAAAAVRG